MQFPKQLIVVDEPFATKGAGEVITAVLVLVHPLASVMSIVQEPAHNPVAVAVVCPFHQE